jgi:succinyl-CoA synthetase beta subunit
MDIHEFQAKEILKKYGVPIPAFIVVSNFHEVEAALNAMGLDQAVLKVQIHAGGRGKAGGVKLAKNRPEILAAAKQLFGMRIVNQQTGKEGIVAQQILISPLVDYQQEYYLAATIDRKNAQAMIIASPEGGVEIEEVAVQHPDKILKLPLTYDGRLRNYHFHALNKLMGWTGSLAEQGQKIVQALAKAFIEMDASLIEINPLVLTNDNKLIALDAKMSFDDNALFRQPLAKEFYDQSQLSPSEAKAKEFDLAYIALDGDIGCMVNGAGLAMATMDIIKHYGGAPANFLDVGGGASQEKVAEGFKIILSDPKVKAILVNIFGGIMNCATLAAGIIEAAKQLRVEVPLVIRMEGTNVEQGKQLLADSGLNISIANNLSDAAEKVVRFSRQQGGKK